MVKKAAALLMLAATPGCSVFFASDPAAGGDDGGLGDLDASAAEADAGPDAGPDTDPPPTVEEVLARTGTVAFVEEDQDAANIWLLEAETGDMVIAPSNSLAQDREPALSPDGKQLAFASNRDGKWRIYVTNLDTGSTAAVTSGGELTQGDREPAWSHSGSAIAFARTLIGDPDNDRVILLIDQGGTEPPSPITTGDVYDQRPAWSKDDLYIAFHRIPSGIEKADCWWVEATGGTPAPITTHEGADSHPSWSPDGQTVAHAGIDGEGKAAIYLQALSGAPRTKLLSSSTAQSEPVWSPSGVILFHAGGIQAAAEDGSWTVELVDGQQYRDPTVPGA